VVDQYGLENRFAEIQVADFGSCVPTSSSHAKNGELIGAPVFRSPEASLHLQWGTATDIWSFGAMVSLLLSRINNNLGTYRSLSS
jgi:serine/threonine protein kinase